MPISVVDVPPRQTAGRHPRLNEEDVIDLANAIREGQWASDGEPTKTKTAAYQRAQSAVKLIGDRFQLLEVKTCVQPVDPHNLEAGFLWSIGPRPAGEKPRRKRKKNAE